MPSSPLMHRSPLTKLTRNHDRGRSFESVRMLKEKDDDLALFNDMSARERENFLLPCADEVFDGSILANLRDLSDVNLGGATPARGDANDLLDDGEKNDYDWLFTPDTPLFPSLDDESDPPPDLQERGRSRTQPIMISRSTSMGKIQSSRASRTSRSPRCRSPSSKSNTSTSHSKVRPSLAPNSGFVRPQKQQAKPSTPPGKPGDQEPAQGSSIGSCDSGSLSSRGASPVNINRGISASPKLSGWQTNLPGFSSDAPPNLRTSFVDSSSSHVKGSSRASRNGTERGTSPAPRNGRETSSMYRRRSTSPPVSRGIRSPPSNDRFSPHSKDFCDDKMDSLQSTLPGKYLGNTSKFVAKKHESFSSPKGSVYSKRAPRTVSTSSGPNRSFDSAMRQMDHHKSPRGMFRPLLSSVPSSSLHVGKANAFHQHLASVSSTVTSRGNTNSEWGVSGVPDTDGSGHERDDLVYQCQKDSFYVNKEVFSSETNNEGTKDTLPMELHAADLEGFGADLHFNAASDHLNACGLSAEKGSENITLGDVDEEANIYVKDRSSSGVDTFENLVTCSKCGEEILEMEILDEKLNVCQSCIRKGGYMCSYWQPEPDQIGVGVPTEDTDLEVVKQCEVGLRVEDCSGVCAFFECDDSAVNGSVQSGSHEEHNTLLLPDREQHSIDSAEQNSETNNIIESPKHGPESVNFMKYGPPSDYCSALVQVKGVNAYPSSRFGASDGTGISLLLGRSSGNKKSLVSGKALSTSSISYDSPSYVTNSFSSTRVTSNTSCSSSVSPKAAPARQTGAHFQRPSSPSKSYLESPRTEIHSDLQNQPLYASVQGCGFATDVCVTRVDVCNLEDAAIDAEGMVSEDILSLHSETSTMLENANLERRHFSSVELSISEHNKHYVKQEVPMDAYSLGRSKNVESVHQEISGEHLDKTCPVSMLSNLDDKTEIVEDFFADSSENVIERGLTIPNRKSSVAMDESVPLDQLNVIDKPSMDRLDTISGVQENEHINHAKSSYRLDTISGVQENEHINHAKSSYSDSPGCQCDSILDQDLSTAPVEDVESIYNGTERSMLDHSPSSKDEGTRKLGGLKRCLSRNMTLEEATDAILFCSSIVHDLAYKAASIAIEKQDPLHTEEDYRPPVTIPVKSDPADTRAPNVPQTKQVPILQTAKTKKQPQKIDDRFFAKMEMEVFYETKIHHVTEPKQDNSTKPPEVESKCNCSVM